MTSRAATTSSAGRFAALTAALLGWLFDGFEMGMFPLVGTPALKELLAGAASIDPKAADRWFSVIMAVFLLGAATGGVLFGWLGDRIGRVRAMSLSIFTYAVFTGLCGFASEAWHLAALRFIASLGMGGEWALGVALVTEIWPDKSRALVAGLIGAAANVGFVLVGVLSLYLVSVLDQARAVLGGIGLSEVSVDKLVSNQGWRLLMIAGALPALLIFFIRLFVPESERWKAEHERGATSRWATRDLVGVLVGALGAGAVILVWSPLVEGAAAREFLTAAGLVAVRALVTIAGLAIALAGFMFPVVQYLRRSEAHGAVPPGSLRENVRLMLFGAALAGIALLGTWGAVQWAPKWAVQLAADPKLYAKEYTQIASALGATFGTIVAALVAGMLGRRFTYSLLCIGSYGVAQLLYLGNTQFNAQFLVCVFLVGFVTAAFYGWFPLYFPELFRTSIRATTQGFTYNFGRVIAAVGTLQTPTLMAAFGGSLPRACSALALVYLLGIGLVWLGPETRGRPLPE